MYKLKLNSGIKYQEGLKDSKLLTLIPEVIRFQKLKDNLRSFLQIILPVCSGLEYF